MNRFIPVLEKLTPDARRLVYERLWFELTIAARVVWSNPDFSEAQKLGGLKWLNEIQHRVWGAHRDPARYAPGDLIAIICGHVENAPHIGNAVKTCLQISVEMREWMDV